MAKITIDRTVDDETPMGIEFTRVYFSVQGEATAEEVDSMLAKEMDDMANFTFDPVTGKGSCVTIDSEPAVGNVYETALSPQIKEHFRPAWWDFVGMVLVGDKRFLFVFPSLMLAGYFIDKQVPGLANGILKSFLSIFR